VNRYNMDDGERDARRLEVINTRLAWLTDKLVGNAGWSTEAQEWDRQLVELHSERRQILLKQKKGDE